MKNNEIKKFLAMKEEWLNRKTSEGVLVEKLSDIVENPDTDFKVGDLVSYVLSGNIVGEPRHILAITNDNLFKQNGRCIRLGDVYWYAFHPESLVKVEE